MSVCLSAPLVQELGDMDPSLRTFVMDEYMCKQRHDWPEGLKFPSQCLLSCMRTIRCVWGGGAGRLVGSRGSLAHEGGGIKHVGC